MRQFVANYSKKKTEEVDPTLFDRTKEKSISEYIVSGLKVIESLPYIKFVDWELITDASKIDIKLNRKHIKDKDLYKNKDITKIISTKDTAQEMLIMKFAIDYEGEHRFITKKLLVPSYVNKYHLLINGKEVLPQKQIVDMSTYNQKKSVKLKTTLTPVDVYTENIKRVKDINDDNSMWSDKTVSFVLNLFTKELNPLYYYFAKFGTSRSINYFSMSGIIDVTDEIYDEDIYYYFPVKDLFIEVDKKMFNRSLYVQSFAYMIHNIYSQSIGRHKLESVDNIDFWLSKLGAIFTTNTKNFISKGTNVLVSFSRILDEITKNTLRIDKRHLKSTHSLIRWILQNFFHLRKKNNHDLAMKRMRCNEVTAFYFIQSMSQRINQLLNKKKLSIEAIERIFNWNSEELFRIMLSSKNTLLKYDPDINCFDMLNALRFSFLGSQGISGGKNIGDQFRDIYPSHLGRIDLNGISHGKNTALTGFIVPKCKVSGEGFFSNKNLDPDEFANEFKEIKSETSYTQNEKMRISEINAIKWKKMRYYRKGYNLEVRDGLFVIHSREVIFNSKFVNKDDNLVVIGSRDPKKIDYQKSYKNKDGMRLNTNGNFIIKHRNPIDKKDNLFKISKSFHSPKSPYVKLHRTKILEELQK